MKRILEVLVAASVIVAGININIPQNVRAAECTKIKIIWTDGSGAVIDGTDNNYKDFRDAVKRELEEAGLAEGDAFSFYELGTEKHGNSQYPAAGVGIESMQDFFTTLGAKMSAGESYTYGNSVLSGVNEMISYIYEVKNMCPDTKFVLGGLSQGAQVTSTALGSLNPDDIIYAATFGDPKLYLPEGEKDENGKVKACQFHAEYSHYRAYVPDCETRTGILEGRNPYDFSGYKGKLGVWCNHHDVICSSYLNVFNIYEDSIAPHGSYGKSMHADDLYSDAAVIIREKIRAFLGETRKGAMKNVAILIDTTGSMSGLIDEYKAEALRLAREVWAEGGEVALFQYRDTLEEDFYPQMLCGFGKNISLAPACTVESFSYGLDSLETSGGGEDPESVLGASYYAMTVLDWKNGADKSIVILTDAGYHPQEEFEGILLDTQKIIQTSEEIDPVIFYTITPECEEESYVELTDGTNGKRFIADGEEMLSFSTDYILDGDAATIRSGVIDTGKEESPEASIYDVEYEENLEEKNVKIKFKTNNTAMSMVFLNDAAIGVTNGNETIIEDIDFHRENTVTIVPYPEEGHSGEAAIFDLVVEAHGSGGQEFPFPKSPDCGKVWYNDKRTGM